MLFNVGRFLSAYSLITLFVLTGMAVDGEEHCQYMSPSLVIWLMAPPVSRKQQHMY